MPITVKKMYLYTVNIQKESLCYWLSTIEIKNITILTTEYTSLAGNVLANNQNNSMLHTHTHKVKRLKNCRHVSTCRSLCVAAENVLRQSVSRKLSAHSGVSVWSGAGLRCS